MTGWLCLGITIVATVAAQLAFKQHFLSRRRLFIPIAAILFCLAVICTYFAVRSLGIGRVYVGAALTYVLAPLAANRMFGEYLGRSQLLALGLIVSGVVIYNV